MNPRLAVLLSIAALCVALVACQSAENIGGTSENTANSAPGTIATASPNLIIADSNIRANAKPETDNSPQRIAFNKGANWGTANVTLAAGATRRFVVSAKNRQTMVVEVSSKEIAVNLIKGKAHTIEDFGYLNAELEANGDYVFEVKNTTKKEIKTLVKVTIEVGTKELSQTVTNPKLQKPVETYIYD